ncbi:MAG: Flp pilus assembly protein CpaB [Proteobacteria bacterium]|nr:Flp pilus assembly protein CpaB [Pseudomonadota bacterium]
MNRTILLAGLALAIAIALVIGYTSMRQSEITRGFGEMIEVVVAKENIPEYGLIRPEQLTTATINKKFVQPQTIPPSLISEVLGRSSYVNIYPGEQITLTKLIQQEGKPVLDKQLEKENRAVTIQISPHTGVGKLIRPGNRVDIMVAAKYEKEQPGGAGPRGYVEVKTVFQNVLVLATGKAVVHSVPTRVNRAVLSSLEAEFENQRRKDLYQTGLDPSTTARPDDNYNTITVQLPLAEAEKLILIQNGFGDQALYLTLRNSAEEAVVPLPTTLLEQVIGKESALGDSKVKLPALPKYEPRFYDYRGGQPYPQ